MDIIDLGRDFFLVWFGCKEDHDLVLEKGPWFLGDHFLLIRHLDHRSQTLNPHLLMSHLSLYESV